MSLPVLRRFLSESPSQLCSRQRTNLLHFCSNLVQKFGIIECIERMETSLERITGKEKQVERRLWESIVNHDEVIIIVYHDAGRE